MCNKYTENVVFRNSTPKYHSSVAWIHADGNPCVQLVHKPNQRQIIAFRNL